MRVVPLSVSSEPGLLVFDCGVGKECDGRAGPEGDWNHGSQPQAEDPPRSSLPTQGERASVCRPDELCSLCVCCFPPYYLQIISLIWLHNQSIELKVAPLVLLLYCITKAPSHTTES